MFRAQLPRLYELRDCVPEPDCDDSYFRDFNALLERSPLASEFYRSLELKLHCLDGDAWKALKSEASQYVMVKDKSRGWPQLLCILNQTHAYAYLKDLGYSTISFIPRSKVRGVKTPDLEGVSEAQNIICEVKTINLSADEVNARISRTARGGDCRLSGKCFEQLDSDIQKARGQILAYDPDRKAHHLVYVWAKLDDWPGACDDLQYRQIQEHLSANPKLRDGVAMCVNGRTV